MNNLQSEIEDLKLNESSENGKLRGAKLTLPSVKELAKQFTPREFHASQIQIDSNRKSAGNNIKLWQNLKSYNKKETGIDHSPATISKVIVNLTNAPSFPSKNNSSLKQTQSDCQKEIGWKDNNNFIHQNKSEKINKAMEHTDTTLYNGKEVHSLTARSISKKFREGLKNSSNHKILEKCVVETEQGDIVSHVRKISPTPSIDLKNMKKFWEEIITANATVKSDLSQINLKGN